MLKAAEAPGQHRAGEFILLRAGAAVGTQAFSKAEVVGWSGEFIRYVNHEAAAAHQYLRPWTHAPLHVVARGLSDVWFCTVAGRCS